MKIKIITTTIQSVEAANNIAQSLINGKFSSCVQIASNIRSFYNWNDKFEESNELLLIIKTIPENVQKCKNIILKHHNYDTPELIVMDGYILEDDYQAWFIEHCRKI